MKKIKELEKHWIIIKKHGKNKNKRKAWEKAKNEINIG